MAGGKKQAYLFVGNDEHPLSLAARELVNARVPPAEQAFGLDIVEGRAESTDAALETIKRCYQALVTPAFLMAGSKLVWWRSVTFFDDVKLAANEDIKEALKDIVSALEEGRAGETLLLVTTPGMDKRSAFYKQFSARAEVREFMMPEKAYLVERVGREKIGSMLREKGLSAEPAAVQMILDRLGADSRLIAMELEKLSLYLGATRRVTVKDVEAVVSSTLTSVMWDLQDALGERKLAKAVEILRELLADGESPIGLVVSLSNRLRDLLLYREGLDQGWLHVRGESAEWGSLPGEVDALFSSAFKRDPRTAHPFVVGRMANQARNYTAAVLRRNQAILTDSYEALVSSRVPQGTVLELMLVRMMS